MNSAVQKEKYFNLKKRPPAPTQKAVHRLISSEKQLNLFCTLYFFTTYEELCYDKSFKSSYNLLW